MSHERKQEKKEKTKAIIVNAKNAISFRSDWV